MLRSSRLDSHRRRVDKTSVFSKENIRQQTRRTPRWYPPNAAAHLLTLTLLDEDHLIRVTHTLTLVRLRLALGANDGGEVTNLHLVVATDDDFRGAGALALETRGHIEDNLMSVAKAEVNGIALHSSLVTDADELELFLETVRHTHHHVVAKGSVQTVTLSGLFAFVRLRKSNNAFLLGHNHEFGELEVERTLGTL